MHVYSRGIISGVIVIMVGIVNSRLSTLSKNILVFIVVCSFTFAMNFILYILPHIQHGDTILCSFQ